MSTLCHPTQPTIKHITGSYQISHLAQKPAGVAYNSGFPSATSVTKASSKRNCAGRMLKIKGLKRYQGHAMMSLALLIGGLVRGSHVQ